VVRLEAVQLEYEPAVQNKSLMLRSAVGAFTCQQSLVPLAACFHVRDGD
jgi:hypothetical protein